MYKIYCYVPEDALESVKQALFAHGAGKIGRYDHCAWQAKGRGQFRPLVDSNPHIGQQGNIESLVEYKLEVVCHDDNIQQVLKALLKAHPYETPAYGAYQILTIAEIEEHD